MMIIKIENNLKMSESINICSKIFKQVLFALNTNNNFGIFNVIIIGISK